MNTQEILALTVNQLKEELAKIHLPQNGNKKELQDRLIQYYETNPNTVGDESVYIDAVRATRSTIFTLRDVEESMTPFSGNEGMKIEEWLERFEEIALTVEWNDLQKLIYGKQLLKGAAKIFIRSQGCIKDWGSLESALKQEFGESINSFDVHNRLRQRRKKQGESLREYLYNLIEIGNPIEIDDASLVQYFIDGINDSKINKSNLYQATTIDELKVQIRIYEKIRIDNPKSSNFKSSRTNFNSDEKGVSSSEESKTCYKCGKQGHLVANCKQKSFTCFKCGLEGHRSFECRRRANPEIVVKTEKAQCNTLARVANLFYKNVKFMKNCFCALFDTGCDINLIRSDILLKFGKIILDDSRITLTGIGDVQIKTIGAFIGKFEIDKIVVEATFHVVDAKCMSHEAIIGREILENVDVQISNEGIQFKLKVGKDVDDELEVVGSAIRSSAIEVEDKKVVKDKKDDMFPLLEFEVMSLAAENLVFRDQVDLSHLGRKIAVAVKDLIVNYRPVKKYESPVKMKILVKDDVPVYERPRRLPHADQEWVDWQISIWLKDGIKRPSNSEYASPIVLVDKKNGKKRLCCDFRRINAKIIRDNFPMPLIDDVVERLQNAKGFITLDLEDGFFHVPLEEGSKKYTSFVSKNGQFEFNYTPFGICNSPAVFTRFITAIMRKFIESSSVVLYMDDILIPYSSEEGGVKKLEEVLKEMSSYGLKIRWEKCQFLVKVVNFLGYIITNGTIRPSEEKVKAVKNFPVPANKQAVQRFIGLTSYFRRFVLDYARIAKPLSDLLKKDVDFIVGAEQLLAFEQLKNALISAPVLKLYNPAATTEIHTDASMHGYGGVLLQLDSEDQEFHPVQFMSRKTKPHEERLHSYELEVLAVIEALKKWRVYLIGKHFKIVTDCNAFAMTMNKRDVPAKISRWAMFLQQFDFEIEHRSGSKMRHVDALSRAYCLLLEDSLRYRLKEAQQSDDWVKVVRRLLESGVEYEDFYLKHDVLHKDPVRQLIVVPQGMEEEIIKMAHIQGHYAVKRTQDIVERDFFIPHINKKAHKIVKNCIECIITDAKVGKKEGMLVPIDKGDKPLVTLHLDHVGPMDATKKNYNYILVVVDAFSKFVWLYPTKTTGTEEVLKSLEKQASVFGNPLRFITDRGTAFTSAAFKQYCEAENIIHLTIATGVPRGNGQVERLHKVVVAMLSKLSVSNPAKWYKNVFDVQKFINTTPSRSTGRSPFRILTGLEMRVAINPDLQPIFDQEAVQELDKEREDLRKEARDKILEIQEENRKGYNRKRKEEELYQINELVAIKRTQFGTGLKLRPKFFGPYKIVRVMRHGRYQVEKIGEHEGPNRTVSVAENMKRWAGSFEGE